MVVDKLLPVSNMASSRSEENVNFRHFQHVMVSQCWWALQFLDSFCFCFCYGRCFSHWFMVMWCYWQMLLPYCHYVSSLCFLVGWCYSHVALLFTIDGDVITIRLMLLALLAGVITNMWLLVLPHWSIVSQRKCAIVVFLADVLINVVVPTTTSWL